MKQFTLNKVGLWILVFGLLLIPHIKLQNYVYDDAYIQIRIATHLVDYGQPFFNIGERVNASSSPVWTILVAAVLMVSKFHLVGIAVLNAAISALGVLAFIELLGFDATRPAINKILLGAGFLAITLPSSIGWMETPLALLVTSVALLRYEKNRPDAFILFGLAPFIRLEFAALYIIVLCDAIIRKKMPIVQLAVFSLVGVAPFLLYELYFFGTIVPNTYRRKIDCVQFELPGCNPSHCSKFHSGYCTSATNVLSPTDHSLFDNNFGYGAICNLSAPS
jgi:hypothetical protein